MKPADVMQATHVNPRQAVQAAYAILSTVQSEPDPAMRILAPAILLVALSERLGFRIPDLLVTAERVMRDGDICREVSAMRQYIDEEIR